MANKTGSLWTDTVTLPGFPALKEDALTDVLIIGGGMAGLLCAYKLQQEGVPYILCEASVIGNGTTAGTTAVLSAQHDILYSDLARKQGEEAAGLYLEANLHALKSYAELAQKYRFDFEERPSYLYSQSDRSKLEQEVRVLERLGFPAKFVSSLPLPLPAVGAVCFPKQAQMHPLKLIKEICAGLHIFEHTPVYKVKGTTAYSGKIRIHAKKIIIATHFPIINTHGLYFAKLYQKRSYVIALAHAKPIHGTFASDEKDSLYFRSYKDMLLIGGGDHRTGRRGGGFDVLHRFAKEHYPDAAKRYAWAAQDCISLDKIPYIGVYSPSMPNVFTASGFNEWGMTTSMAAAELLCDLVLERENPYKTVFSPSRSILKPQLFCNIGVTALDFLTPTAKRCPHLGCALKWNPAEHSWDCPCHGSRFDESGRLLNNPATGDLRKADYF